MFAINLVGMSAPTFPGDRKRKGLLGKSFLKLCTHQRLHSSLHEYENIGGRYIAPTT